ncbi:hypothetical protein NDU88_005053 [Pleurodeles waltl]|uniref:Uncharacterized protein n=1 Tax=Pleurodeles waltl TaxID=8319 RepID=A0AAV7WTQ2_PLEWA|nr:hypothetical protein NDU88_005053 [Pleurodeles waltl]
MDAIPNPDVLRSGTIQVELPGEEGQREALCTVTKVRGEEKVERRGRDSESDNGERNSSSDGGSEGSKPREREGGGGHWDGRVEKGSGSPGGSLEVKSGTGTRRKTRRQFTGPWPRSGKSVATAGVWGRT